MKKTISVSRIHRVIAVLAALCLLMTTLAACGSNPPGGKTETTATTTAAETAATTAAPEKPASWLGDEPVKITFLYADNGSYPFNKDWLVLEEIKKRTNADLEFTVVPDADYGNKLKILLGSGDIPDVISKTGMGDLGDFAQNGVILSVDDYMDVLPNFKAYLEKLGPDVKKEVDNQRLKQDNKLYCLPGLLEKPSFDSGMMIRSDLLKKYGMSTPKTTDDLYAFLKKYKEENPKSAPLTWQYGSDGIFYFMSPYFRVFIPQNWGCPDGMYYDWDEQKFVFAADSPKTKAFIGYLAKLHKEGLLDPELYTQNDNQWSQKMINGTSVATYGWIGMDGKLVEGGKGTNPDYAIEWVPALSGIPGKSGMTEPKNRTRIGYGFPASLAKDGKAEKVLKFIDWVSYSDEGRFLTNFGVEGVTCKKDASGKWVYIDEIMKDANYGNKTFGLTNNNFGNVCPMFEAGQLFAAPNFAELTKFSIDNGMFQPVAPAAKFTADESEQVKLLAAPLADHFFKESMKFIFSKRDVEKDWDALMQECKAKGSDKLTEIFNKAIGK